MFKTYLGAVLFLCAIPALAIAQPDHADIAPGHSYQGEAFNEGPRQRAYLMGKTGNVRFPITTNSKEAQVFFEQGVGQLHGFWYFEAERSFRQVALLDPDCAMAYWGMAMANHENEKRAAGFIKTARNLLRNAPRRERLYIESMTELLLTTGDKRKRQEQCMAILKKIGEDYPDDLEARAFYVVRAWQWKMAAQGPALDRMLDDIFKTNPVHPAHHYRIHLWDGPNPAAALFSASWCGASSPACAHMWHMPGHTYDKLKRYAEAAWQQEASSRADHAYMMRDRVLPDQIHNYAHNQEWLVRSLSHIGRVNDAVALAKNMIELPRHPKYNMLARGGKSASFGRTRLFELLERYELWDETLKLADTMYLEPTETPAEQIKRMRLMGLAQAGKGETEKLARTIAALKKHPTKGGPPFQPKGKGGPKGGKFPPMDAGAARDNAVRELEMLDHLLAERPKEALEMLASIKTLPPTRQARYYLQAGDKAKAEQLAKQAADMGKNQVAPLALYIEALDANEKTKECAEAFERLRKISGDIDSLKHPTFHRLEPIAKKLKLPADWRIRSKFPPDFGKRPPLESIGPLRWQPTKAPAWPFEKTLAGGPTVVLFYLGEGCPHCVEQIGKFAERQKDFKAAGIALAAVSTDPPEALERAAAGPKKLPFPIAANPTAEVFQRFRAFDDFENQPLHATFLIDGKGFVRWHDIGFEPFMDVGFVLNEAKRLLALPVN